MDNKQVFALARKNLVFDASFASAFHTGSGVRFQDIEGGSYIDFSSGYGVSNVGWQHPEMIAMLQQQAAKSNYAPPWMPTEEAALLAERLVQFVPDTGYKVLRATGGGDANEIILKVLFASQGMGSVLSFYRSYHGGTHAALGMSDIKAFKLPEIRKDYEEHKVEPPYCFRCPVKKDPATCNTECLQLVEEKMRAHPDIRIFMAEPILGSGGVIVPPKNYFTQLRALCDQYNVVLVMDEVLTGNGRTGHWLASEYYSIVPDAFSLAKGLASGYAAIGAAVIKEEYLETFYKYDDVSSSFAWSPMSCAVALKNLEILERDSYLENARIQGDYLKTNFEFLMRKKLPDQFGEVRGLGAMIGCEFVDNQQNKNPNPRLSMRVLLGMLKRGCMWCASWDYTVMIAMPPLCITKEESDEALNILEASL